MILPTVVYIMSGQNILIGIPRSEADTSGEFLASQGQLLLAASSRDINHRPHSLIPLSCSLFLSLSLRSLTLSLTYLSLSVLLRERPEVGGTLEILHTLGQFLESLPTSQVLHLF